MKCYKCFQDKFFTIEDDNDKTHIMCETCGLDIKEGGNDFLKIYDLITFNLKLSDILDEGKKAYEEGITLNPYLKENHSYEGQELSIMKSWDEGWEKGEKEMQNEAFFSSSENLKKEAIELIKEKEHLIREKNEISLKTLDLLDIIKNLNKNKYFLGSSYRVKLDLFSKKIKDIKEYFNLP